MAESLKNTTLHNVGYNSIARVVQIVVMAVANIILTRTLAPSDYGIVGFACIFTAFLSQFSDLGIGSALIQQKELEQRDINTAFTIKFFIGLVIFTLTYLSAPLALRFFDNPAIVGVIRFMAFNFVLNSIIFLPGTLMTRSLDYKRLATGNLVPILLNSVSAVVLALLGFKYWSLVVASLVMSVSSCIVMNFLHPVKYRFAFSRDAADRLIKFGGNVFVAGVVTFLTFNLDNFLIGTMEGATNLGFYSLAFNWGSMICTLISGMVLSVLFPTFSRMQGERGRIKSSYLRVLQIVSFGGVLVNMTLFVVSRDFLFLVLGHETDKWLPALTVLRILCFYGVIRLLLEPVGQVMMALARTDVLRKATLLVVTIELIGLFPAIHYFGIEGVAVLITLAYLSQYIVYYRVLRKELQVNLKDLWVSVGPSLWSLIIFCPFLLLLKLDHSMSYVYFLSKLVCCFIIYFIMYGLLTRWRLYGEIRAMIGVRT
jgi:lipopolysaccharide exporter